MITIGYSTKTHKPELIEYFKKSSGNSNHVEVIEKINQGDKSLSQVYNEIINEAKSDIVILCHDDIYFDTPAWYSKVQKSFEKNDFGILGVAGTTHLSQSGMWWETNRRKNMVGIVNHESGGKKWESRYSSPQGNEISQVAVVDGVFIAIHKLRIKKLFVEDFKGFHFYDLPFCLENHLEGVKIGVTTNIRITHKSIGQTNQQWEDNRKQFIENYGEVLPVKIPFNEKKRMNVLLSCLFFRGFTGSEVYVYELAKSLVKNNCNVTVLSQIGGPLTDLARKNGIKVFSFEEAPGFKIGDGKWIVTGPDGTQQVSSPSTLYKIGEVDFDIIHVQHKPVVERIISLYPNIDKVCTIHSEVMSKNLEDPVEHESIKKYISIRPEIKTHLINNFNINESQIEIIYNPVDENKFKIKNSQDKNYVLFVGTVDYLRRESILDLIEYTEQNNKELWLVGENHSEYLESILLYPHVKHFPSTWELNTFISNCSETAGIQLGRTTIESWIAGKKSWIYKVDSNGFILSKELTNPPEDLEKFYSMNVAKQIKTEYLKILS
jgi:glycosyltransferase involved in cell wall biosynthesis